VSQLLARLQVTKQSINRVLKDLTKNKIIIQKKGDLDGRQRLIYLNENGKKLFNEIFYSQKKRIYNALKNSESDSVLKFKKVIERIVND